MSAILFNIVSLHLNQSLSYFTSACQVLLPILKDGESVLHLLYYEHSSPHISNDFLWIIRTWL